MNSELIYVDTNVIMDFLLARNPAAYSLFMRALSCEYALMISDIVLAELDYQGLRKESTLFLRLFLKNEKLVQIKADISDRKNAKSIKSTHYNDALHKVLRKRYKARYLVTNNIKDFQHFADIKVKRPDCI